MKNSVKELTEGMQRLCAIANKIVAHDGEVSRIERDLLLDDLRRLYDVALRLDEGAAVEEPERAPMAKESVVDEEILSSTVMATMAAMAPAPAEEKPVETKEPESPAAPAAQEITEAPEPEPVEQPAMEDIEDNGNSLLFDEVIIEETSAPEPQEPEAVEPQEVVETSVEPEPVPAPEPEHHATAGTQASLLDYLKRPAEEKPVVKTLGEKLGERGEAAGRNATAGTGAPSTNLSEQ